MNWTGGALSRSRNTNAKLSLSIKQKNHFAKARAKLQGDLRPSPSKIQYFDFGEWKPESEIQDDQPSKPVKRRVSSQRTLDQFENVQGVVRKLKSLRPRKEGKKRERSLINDTEGHVLPSGIAIPPISPIIISSRSPSGSSSSPVQAVPTAKGTYKRLRSLTSSTSDELDTTVALDCVEAKRRKLLQESDWVGIEKQRRMSKPVKMRFTDAEDRDLIGRRRPLNNSAVTKRWKIQEPRRARLPLMASDSEEQGASHGGIAVEYGSMDGLSIRIGSTATNKGPISDEILDRYKSPRLVQGSSRSRQTFDYDSTGPLPRPQHGGPEVTTSSDCRDESSEPFRSLFSPEEVEQSGIAQLVEAATIADDGNLPLAEDGLQLPEDYHFPVPEPGFRLVFEQTPRPHGQTSEFIDSSSPIVRDFALSDGHLPGAPVEQTRRLEQCNTLEELISRDSPVEDAESNTSPLSIATSRYMQELEKESFGTGGQIRFGEDMAKNTTTARSQPVVKRNVNKAEQEREATCVLKPKVSGTPNEVQDTETVLSTEDENDIWRTFVDLDNVKDHPTNQEQPTSTHISHVTAAKALAHSKPVPDHAPTESPARNAPPLPQDDDDDDEHVWRKFIFSDSDANNDDWDLEEARSPNPARANDRISSYNPARTQQPSMVAEAATSPLKQNPHLTGELMLDDTALALDDDASRYANASTSSTGGSGTADDASSMPRRVLPHPSNSPDRSSSLLTAASPAIHEYRSHVPSDPPPTNETSRRNPHASNPSSLIAEASSSAAIPSTERVQQPLSSPADSTSNNSTSNNSTSNKNHHPSSDEIGWTPSRLPGGPPIAKEKVVFKKPSRYVGERAPEPVHLGRKVSGRKRKKKEKTSVAGTVERAKEKVGGNGRTKKSMNRRDLEYESEEDQEDEDEDEIVDD